MNDHSPLDQGRGEGILSAVEGSTVFSSLAPLAGPLYEPTGELIPHRTGVPAGRQRTFNTGTPFGASRAGFLFVWSKIGQLVSKCVFGAHWTAICSGGAMMHKLELMYGCR